MSTAVATQEPGPAPVTVIRSGEGGIGMGGAALGLGLLVGGSFAYQKWAADKEKAKAEAELSTEPGQIAAALKVVFDATFPSGDEYRRIAQRINATNKTEVYRIYKALTGKNLSDELTRLQADVVEKSAKVEAYNSKTGGLFRVAPDGKIQFQVVKGDTIRFTPGQTAPIRVYATAQGIILEELLKNPPVGSEKDIKDMVAAMQKDPKTVVNTVSVLVKPTSKLYPVVQTKEIPVTSVKVSDAPWYRRLVQPLVRTKKVFAAIQIITGVDPKTGKNVAAWIDARDMMTGKSSVKGLGIGSLL